KQCDAAMVKQNAARLRFYAGYGAYPILNTAYETPLSPEDTCMPHLLFDDLGRGLPLRRLFARQAVRAILEKKYAHLCSPQYTAKVVNSFHDDPVLLRKPKQTIVPRPIVRRSTLLDPIALLVNTKHNIHHVRERGYVEAPVRIRSILTELEQTQLFQQ